MSWLTEVIRPKIRNLFARRDVPENLWVQCAGCQRMIFTKDFLANMRVCADCGHHMRGTAVERLEWTFDTDAFTRIELPKAVVDPLKFRDTKRYADRLKRRARKPISMTPSSSATAPSAVSPPSSPPWSSPSSAVPWAPDWARRS